MILFVWLQSLSESFATPWAVAHQAPLSMGFPRQEYWSGLPFLSPGDLPHPGMEPTSPVSPTWQVDSLPVSYLGSPRSDIVKVAQSCQTLCDPMDYSVHGILQASTGEGSLSLLQGIFPTQGLNPGLPHCRWILYQPSYRGSPRILEWVAYPCFSRSSPPRGLSSPLRGLLNCRCILYHLSCQGSPEVTLFPSK